MTAVGNTGIDSNDDDDGSVWRLY